MPPVSASPGNDSGRPGFIRTLRQLRENPAQARAWLSERAPAIIGFAVPFLLVFYLAMREGGYGEAARGELGVAVWVVLLLGGLAGLLRIPNSRRGWVGIGLLVAFAAWTGLAALWSESAERTAIEAGRVATLLGVFVLALCIQGAGTLRRTVAAVGAAIALISVLSLGSRLLPDLFPANQVADVLPTEAARLGYPVAYWNGLATLVAIGMPILLLGAGSARANWVRAVACAALPILALTSFFTLSRGGVVEAAIGIGALVLLMPNRPRIAVPAVISGLGAAVLIALANGRTELSDALDTDVAKDQGLEMLAITIVICLLVAGANLFAQRRAGERPAALPRGNPATGRRVTAGVGCRRDRGGHRRRSPRQGQRQLDRVQAALDTGWRHVALSERQRQWPLPVVGLGRRRRLEQPGGRHRPRHIRILVGAR